jgi:hypothetical protein
MIYTQLVYGLVVATNMVGTNATMFSGGAPLAINPPTQMEIFEAIGERAAALGWPRGAYVSPTLPFTCEPTNRAGFRLVDGHVFTNYDSGGAYLVTNGLWKSWSFNPFRQIQLYWSYSLNDRFIPALNYSLSSALWKVGSHAIDNMAPYYMMEITPTSAVPWTASNLWVAAGSAKGNPFAIPFFIDLDYYYHVGTNEAWIFQRALTLMHTTLAWDVTRSNAVGFRFGITNYAYPTVLGPVYDAMPAWAQTSAAPWATFLCMTNSGLDLTNRVIGYAPPYASSTNGLEDPIYGPIESITFNGLQDWFLNFTNNLGTDVGDYYRAHVPLGRMTFGDKKLRSFHCRIQEMGAGVTAVVSWAVSATGTVTAAGADVTNTFSAMYWETNLEATVVCGGIGTNWAGTAAVTAAVPDVGAVLDLTQVAATGRWDNLGVNAKPVIDVECQLYQARPAAVRWFFNRCRAN